MTKDTLIKAGYQRWQPSAIDNECVTDLFEKCIKDNVGKRYFIHIRRWDFSRYEPTPTPPRYEATVQFELNNGDTIDVEYLCGDWSIEDLEKFYADMWNLGWFKYHERYYLYDEEAKKEKEKTPNDK